MDLENVKKYEPGHEDLKPEEPKHTEQNINKFNEALKTMERTGLSEEKRREVFEKQGMSDLYEKEIDKKKVIERTDKVRAVEDKYKEAHSSHQYQYAGTFRGRKHWGEMVGDFEGKIANMQDGAQKENLKSSLEKAKQAFAESEDILNTKLGIMEPQDAERIQEIDTELGKIQEEMGKNLEKEGENYRNNKDKQGNEYMETKVALAREKSVLEEKKKALEMEWSGLEKKYKTVDGKLNL